MTKKMKDPNAVLEQFSKVMCLYAYEYGIHCAVAVSFERPDGKTVFTAFGNTDTAEIQQLFSHGAKVVSSSEPTGHYEHKVEP